MTAWGEDKLKIHLLLWSNRSTAKQRLKRGTKAYGDAQTERLLRNLLYAGITRVLDSVNTFSLEGDDPILRDLEACFGREPPEAA